VIEIIISIIFTKTKLKCLFGTAENVVIIVYMFSKVNLIGQTNAVIALGG